MENLSTLQNAWNMYARQLIWIMPVSSGVLSTKSLSRFDCLFCNMWNVRTRPSWSTQSEMQNGSMNFILWSRNLAPDIQLNLCRGSLGCFRCSQMQTLHPSGRPRCEQQTMLFAPIFQTDIRKRWTIYPNFTSRIVRLTLYSLYIAYSQLISQPRREPEGSSVTLQPATGFAPFARRSLIVGIAASMRCLCKFCKNCSALA